MTHCPICLAVFRDPVCIPCGHVYCKTCLTDHSNAPGNDGLTAKCPECRTSFDLVIPDLTYLPKKYHKFVTHNVRRIFFDFSSVNELRGSLKAAESRLAQQAATEKALLTRCEELTEALNAANRRSDTEQGLEQGRAQLDAKKEKEKDGQDFLTAKIITDDTFSRHKTFDLAVVYNGTQPLSDLPTFCVPQYEPYSVFKSRVAQHFKIPENQIRLWPLVNRQNKTVRPDTYQTEPSMALETIRKEAKRRDLVLYLDILPAPMVGPVALEKNTPTEDVGMVLIFLKHFDTTTQSLVAVGKCYAPRARKASDLIPIINGRMGWASGTPLHLYEEVKPGCIQPMNLNFTLTQGEIGDGDIICFQMVISAREAREVESRGLYSNPQQFYKSLENRMKTFEY